MSTALMTPHSIARQVWGREAVAYASREQLLRGKVRQLTRLYHIRRTKADELSERSKLMMDRMIVDHLWWARRLKDAMDMETPPAPASVAETLARVGREYMAAAQRRSV